MLCYKNSNLIYERYQFILITLYFILSVKSGRDTGVRKTCFSIYLLPLCISSLIHRPVIGQSVEYLLPSKYIAQRCRIECAAVVIFFHRWWNIVIQILKAIVQWPVGRGLSRTLLEGVAKNFNSSITPFKLSKMQGNAPFDKFILAFLNKSQGTCFKKVGDPIVSWIRHCQWVLNWMYIEFAIDCI